MTDAMITKPRNRHGEKKHFSPAVIHRIRKLAAKGMKQIELAEAYGISPAAISKIINRISYKWVKE